MSELRSRVDADSCTVEGRRNAWRKLNSSHDGSDVEGLVK